MGSLSNKNPRWTLRQVVDFESQRLLDRGQDEQSLEARDRAIYRSCEQQTDTPVSDRILLHHWWQSVGGLPRIAAGTRAGVRLDCWGSRGSGSDPGDGFGSEHGIPCAAL